MTPKQLIAKKKKITIKCMKCMFMALWKKEIKKASKFVLIVWLTCFIPRTDMYSPTLPCYHHRLHLLSLVPSWCSRAPPPILFFFFFCVNGPRLLSPQAFLKLLVRVKIAMWKGSSSTAYGNWKFLSLKRMLCFPFARYKESGLSGLLAMCCGPI